MLILGVVIKLTICKDDKPVDGILIYRLKGKTCMRKNGRKLKLKNSVNHRSKRPRTKESPEQSTADLESRQLECGPASTIRSAIWGETDDSLILIFQCVLSSSRKACYM